LPNSPCTAAINPSVTPGPAFNVTLTFTVPITVDALHLTRLLGDGVNAATNLVHGAGNDAIATFAIAVVDHVTILSGPNGITKVSDGGFACPGDIQLNGA
jgi:hypothetical protein